MSICQTTPQMPATAKSKTTVKLGTWNSTQISHMDGRKSHLSNPLPPPMVCFSQKLDGK